MMIKSVCYLHLHFCWTPRLSDFIDNCFGQTQHKFVFFLKMFFFLFEIDFQWTKSIPFLTYPQCSVKNSISWRKDKTKLSATVRYWRKTVFVTRLSFLQNRQPYKADLLSIWKHGNAEGVKVIIITQWEQQVDGYGGRLDWGGTVGNMVGIALIRKGTLPTHHAMFVWNQQIRMQLERQLQLCWC